MNMNPNYYIDVIKPEIENLYARGRYVDIDGDQLTLDEALSFLRGAFYYLRRKEMLRTYPPSLWAHGGKRVIGC